MYGILISLSILISLLIAEYFVRKDKKDVNTIWELGIVSIIVGIFGARLYHVIDYWTYYSQDIYKVFYLWEGGLGIFGAIILGFISSVVYLKIKNKDIWYYVSIITIVMPLGQAIGRWGNYFNNELYGKVTTLPWGININSIRHHPLFFYESILNLILFFILINLKSKKNMEPKVLIGIYLAGYSIIRFILEFLRIDPWQTYGLNVAQLVSIILLGLSYILISRKNK